MVVKLSVPVINSVYDRFEKLFPIRIRPADLAQGYRFRQGKSFLVYINSNSGHRGSYMGFSNDVFNQNPAQLFVVVINIIGPFDPDTRQRKGVESVIYSNNDGHTQHEIFVGFQQLGRKDN